MLAKYLDDTVTIWLKQGVNKFGEASYDVGSQMLVRFVNKSQLITNSNGKEVVSNTVVYCNQEVHSETYFEFGEVLNDSDPKARINAKIAIRIERHRAISGNEILWKVFL